jgi:hypothetical protein
LVAELARATGFAGRGRCFADEAEVEPVLGGEIGSRLVTGTRCVYRGADLGANPLKGEKIRAQI